MDRIKDEQFSAEVEKRLHSLFNDSDNKRQAAPLDGGYDGSIPSEEEMLYEISEEDLLIEESNDENTIEEISEEDLLGDATDGREENLPEDLFDHDSDESVLADELDNELLDDNLNEDLFDDSIDGKSIEIENEDVSIKEEGEFNFYPFRLLKSIILSIDWEITEDVMDRLISQVTGLMETYKDDKFVLIFLHLLLELGKYIKKHRGQSHPNSIKTLNSVYNGLEKIFSSKTISDSEKKKILSAEMLKFKTLKEQITLQLVPPSQKTPIIQANVLEKTVGKMDEMTLSMEMTEMIRTVVRSELKAIIKEFAEWSSKR